MNQMMGEAAAKQAYKRIPVVGGAILWLYENYNQPEFFVVEDRVIMHSIYRNWPKSPHVHRRLEDSVNSQLEEGGKLFKYRN